MIHFKPGSHAYNIIDLLSVTGEFPLCSLDILGSRQTYENVIRRMLIPQKIVDGQEDMTCKLLNVSGMNGRRKIRLTKEALPLLELMGAKEYYYENFMKSNPSSNGNIITRRETAFTLKQNVEECDFETFIYSYEGDRLISYNGEQCTYNQLGSPTKYRGKTATWTYGKLLTNFNGTTFTYDGIGRRMIKGGISYTYDNEGKLIKQSNGLEFIYDESGVAGIKLTNIQYLFRKDAQGNIVAILDNNGNIVVQYKYDAWGNHAVLDRNGNDITNTSNIGNLNPFRYRGYYYDTETGLYYLQTRYYDPEVGRFISQDSIEYADPETINGINLYAYCGNNPVMGYDPGGTWNWGMFWACIVAFASVISIAVGAVLCVTGVGAPIGGILIGAGIGGILGEVSSIVSQISSGSTINWGQVAFNGAMGMVSGALMASPLGAVPTGIGIGTFTFVQSVGNDLFDNNGDWSKVDWGTAVLTGALSGGVSGLGKYLLQNTSLMNKFINSRHSVKVAADAIKSIGSISRGSYINFWKQIMIAQGIYTYGIKFLTGLTNGLVKLINI